MAIETHEALRPLTLGVDLGGTKIETALVDGSGRILAAHRRPTNPDGGPPAVIADIIECVGGCVGPSRQQVQALGIGVAGQVDAISGSVRFAPNLDWHDVPLRAELETALGLPVAITNDVRAATWGEWLHGAGQGIDDLVVLFVGTGVGGGIVSGGRILEGCANTAGELGHITLVAEGRSCRCPNRGCLEAYAGGWAIAQRAQEAVRADPRAGARLVSLAGTVETITSATVSQAYLQKDALAARLVEETALYLGAGVVSIVNALNPCLFVLGGGVVEGLPDLVPMVERAVRAHALKAAVEALRVVRSLLGGEAGVLGAAALARKLVGEPA